jgi:hypothetical protein
MSCSPSEQTRKRSPTWIFSSRKWAASDCRQTERGRDQVAIVRRGRLPCRDQALVDLIAEQRVVAGQQAQLAGTQAVHPRIADMRQNRMILAEAHQRQGGAHAMTGWILFGSGKDRGIGRVDRAPNRLYVPPGTPPAEAGKHRVAGHPAGHPAVAVAAHAVGNDGNAGPGIGDYRILVVRAHPTRIGESRKLQAEANHRHIPLTTYMALTIPWRP